MHCDACAVFVMSSVTCVVCRMSCIVCVVCVMCGVVVCRVCRVSSVVCLVLYVVYLRVCAHGHTNWESATEMALVYSRSQMVDNEEDTDDDTPLKQIMARKRKDYPALSVRGKGGLHASVGCAFGSCVLHMAR